MRHSSFFLLVFLFNYSSAIAQSPGGISANNTMWLKSDVGLTSVSNIVSQWQELSGANVTGNFTVQPLNGTANAQTGPTVVDAGINFNPYVRFDGVVNSLSSINIFPGTSLVSNTSVTVFQVFNLKGGIVWLKWETDQVGATGRLGFENSGGNIRFDFPKAIPASSGQDIGGTNVLNKHSLSTGYADATLSINRLNGANDNTLALPGGGDFSIFNDKVVIGNENFLNLPAQIDMAEVIIYSTTLTAAERNKIESYLAVKYGFTLDQAAINANDYTSAAGTIIWNRAANSAYASDITGIGREDASSLSQKQSKSINSTSLVTIYNGIYAAGNFPLLNSANTNFFSTDASCLLFGDNAGTTTGDQCIFNGKGKRMQRTWKASKSGNIGQVTLSVDQASVPSTVKNIIVSADPAFPLSGTVIYPLTATGGKLYAQLNLNHNDFFTYATDTLVVTMVVTQPLCSNPNSGNVTTTVTGNTPPTTYSWSPSGQATANLVNVPGGTYTLTITQGACQSFQQITLTSPASPPAPFANAVALCTGNTATLSVQNPNAGYTYNWYAAAAGGVALGTGTSFTTPVITANIIYYLEAVSGTCVSVRTPVTVSLTTIAPPLANGLTICSGATATLNIVNPNSSYTYNWYEAASGGTAIGTGNSFTTPALSQATTYYVEAVNTGCSSIRTPVIVSITTVSAPTSAPAAVCPGNTATLSVQNPDINHTYTWYSSSTGGAAIGSGISIVTSPVSSAIDYYVEASDGICNSIRTPVSVNLIPTIDTPQVIVAGSTNNSVSFSWQPVAGASGYEVSVDGSPYTSSGNELTFTVSGLPVSQTVTIAVIAIGSPQSCGNSAPGHATGKTYGGDFYIPSAFTPNGDATNDVLIPTLPGGSVLLYFTIYNRWGQKIFTTNTIGSGWDGKLQGKQQPIGTFVWACMYTLPAGRTLMQTGTVLLLH